MAEPRYVLSARAADELRALIAPGSGYGSRPRRIGGVSEPASAQPRPFDIRFGMGVASDGVTPTPALFCYLPSWASNQNFTIVRADEIPIRPSSAQQIGATDPWVQIATVGSTSTYRVFLGFLDERETSTDIHQYRWQLWVQSGTGTPRPSGFSQEVMFPYVFIARVNRAAVEQLVDGAIHVARQWVRQLGSTNQFCLWDSSNVAVFNIDTKTLTTPTIAGALTFDASPVLKAPNNKEYYAISLTVDGVSYEVIGRRL